MYLQNLHTHSSYCDGLDTPERMLMRAQEKGFQSIGFSGHSYMYYAPSHSMTLVGTELYKQQIAYLKQKFAGQMDVFCGLEFDIFSEIDMTGIDRYFKGDGLAYAKAYYKTLATLPEYGKFDIIGHYDLITKHQEKNPLFDTTCKEYRFAAIEAAEALQGKIPCFEVNTGAISRGFRTSPYPDKFIIKEMKRLGYGVVITSDCHDANFVDCHFAQSRELLRECGYTEQQVLTKDGFVPTEL